MRPSRLAIAFICLYWVALPAAELPDGFRLEPVLGGLTDPYAIDVVPGGDILIAERTTGNLRRVYQGQLQAAPVCSPAVNASGEGGLLGVTAHPKYPNPAWVYLYYTDAGAGVNRVVRYTLGPGGCTDATVIVSDLGSGSLGLQNGGGLKFGADGKLYVATGDVEDPGNGQDPGVLKGKVLRLEDDGSIPADNPTPGSAVYTIGVRDGNSLAASPSGQIYVLDRGDSVPTSIDDEINVAPAGGNLGWAFEWGPGGVFTPPLVSWNPPVGLHGLTLYAAGAFPDVAADGLDSDHDRFGPDLYPGVARANDQIPPQGACIGSANNLQTCYVNSDCPPRSGGEPARCEFRDDLAEYCPLGSAYGDDACGNTGAAGIDEPDESYVNSVFASFNVGIQRAVPVPGSPGQLSSWSTFFDGSGAGTLPDDCPFDWTGVDVGQDGFMYALATNGGGVGAGALYRIVHEGEAGPREVSAPGSPFQLLVNRGSGDSELELTWEDLREDSRQPQWVAGGSPLPPARTYTVWRGTMGGNYTTHASIPTLALIPGNPVNDALRREIAPTDPGVSQYYLVSGVGDNIEGTLGSDSSGVPRLPLGGVDLCPTNGYYDSPSWQQFGCGRGFTLLDEHNQSRSLSEFRGKVLLLDFSAIWCSPCQSEADDLENVYQEYRDRGVEILTVLMDEESPVTDWNGRPAYLDCLNWSDRVGSNPDHTFSCWTDPAVCPEDDPSPCDPDPGRPAFDQYDAFNNVLPQNFVMDQATRVVYAATGYDAVIKDAITDAFDALVGTTDSCLH